MNEIIPMKTRFIAGALELVPLVGAAMLSQTHGGSTGWILALCTASGLGWALIGHWDIGVGVWLGRMLILIPATMVAGFIGLGISDCVHCSEIPALIAFSVLVVLFVGSVLASALFVMIRQH